MHRTRLRLFAAVLLLLAGGQAGAVSLGAPTPQVLAMFPEASSVEPPQGDPPASRVLAGARLVGYALLTADIAPIPAYSGKPVNCLVGIDLQGRIRGARIVAHQEPILVVGISAERLDRFIAQYPGKSVTDDIRVGGETAPGRPVIDALTGATITTMVVNASVNRSIRRVAASRGLGAGVTPTSDEESASPLWPGIWLERLVDIGVLSTGLLALLLVLLFQDWLARHPTLLGRVRTAYLLFTLLFLGWYGLAQLSVVNVLTFVHALLGGFSWDSFLMDPMLFLLWSFVAVTVLLWGRGVYCGWLCPFGALQELAFRAAKRIGIPSWEPPTVLHERLWALKYVILLALFGASLHSLPMAERLAEAEPFKTAFALHFLRAWPFVAYALALLVAGLFVRKLFCRYLCPLGAALTFPGRFRIFDWLRRRRECGRPCQTCAVECEVGAIRPTGEIIDNECHYCLDCQVTYWNDHKCPPLVEKRKRSEVRERIRRGAAKAAAVAEHDIDRDQ